MPSKRFEKLSDTKREKIIWAIIDEFVESGYDGASINSVIKKADISRGSFYTYFENKDDMFAYVMDSFTDIAMDFMLKILEETGGDVIDMIIKLYDTHEDIKKEKTGKLFRLVDTLGEKIFTTKRAKSKRSYKDENFFQSKKGKEFCKRLQDNSNEHFRQYSEDKFSALMELLSTIAFKTVFTKVVFNTDGTTARNRMIEWLCFIRNGI